MNANLDNQKQQKLIQILVDIKGICLRIFRYEGYQTTIMYSSHLYIEIWL